MTRDANFPETLLMEDDYLTKIITPLRFKPKLKNHDKERFN